MLDAERIMQRCDELARHSEQPGGLTRVFLSPQYRAAADLPLGWMREAGMAPRSMRSATSSAATRRNERCTVPDPRLTSRHGARRRPLRRHARRDHGDRMRRRAGARRPRLPFALEVIGFGDEEGVRFGTTMLGSRALAGRLDADTLESRDAAGIPCGKRCATSGWIPSAADWRVAAGDLSPMSSCTSSRDRCSRPRDCRSVSSPRSTASPALRAACAALPDTPGPCR